MQEIIAALHPTALVLDLGCAKGSFSQSITPATVIRIDREVHNVTGEALVQGDAARLPFKSGSVHAIVANHSLEHFDQLRECLNEIGRVLKTDGSLFVSVPCASTVTDKLYRWLARGGGHVNAFVTPDEVIRAITAATGLEHVATVPLCSSLSFLNRRNSPYPRPRRLLLLGGGRDVSLLLYTWLSRRMDRLLNLRTSMYGWAFYFGNVLEPVDTSVRVNVCIGCGAATPSALLMSEHRTHCTWYGLRLYCCPHCGSTNTFAHDPAFADS